MIEAILPNAVVVEEARGDPPGVSLFPSERAALGNAVAKRRAEFTTVRHCARRALARLDLPPAPILPGPRGAPQWPAGIVGSITHCAGYRACALAPRSELMALGIDAEPHLPLPAGVLATVAMPRELHHLRSLARALPDVCWDRLLFSAKEAVYKAWFPLTGTALGFADAVLAFNPSTATFHIRPLGDRPCVGEPLTALAGRWLIAEGLLITAVTLLSAVDSQMMDLGDKFWV